MLIKCPECEHMVSDKAIACPQCGLPFLPMSSTKVNKNRQKVYNKRASNTRRHRRLPNGFGSVKRLSGKRNKPYAAYPPVQDYYDNGSPVSTKALGYFRTYNEAYQCLLDFNKNGRKEICDYTFSDMYNEWLEKKNPTQTYVPSAFKNLKPLHDIKMVDLKTNELQDAIDCIDKGYSTLNNAKIVLTKVFEYAIQNDYIDKNYSEYVSIGKENDSENGEPFSIDAIKILWEHTDEIVIRYLLCLMYSGYRINEFYICEPDLDRGLMIGGLKTAGGRNRIVPIHPLIKDWIQECHPLFDTVMSEQVYRKKLDKLLEDYGILYEKGKKHTPHDARHTFSWLWDKYLKNEDDIAKKMIMGHSLGKDVESKVYSHRTDEELITCMNRIGKY